MKRPLIVLTGPTAVGKTSLSIYTCKAVNEIISMRFHAGIKEWISARQKSVRKKCRAYDIIWWMYLNRRGNFA